MTLTSFFIYLKFISITNVQLIYFDKIEIYYYIILQMQIHDCNIKVNMPSNVKPTKISNI